MRERRISLVTYVMTLIIMSIISIALIIGLIISINQNKDVTTNNNTSGKEEEDNAYSTAINYLTNGKLISTSDVVGSGYPGGYYFTKEGTFGYTEGETEVTKNGQTLGVRGTWKVENDQIIIHATELQRAEGGNAVSEDQNQIENYEKKVYQISQEKHYTIKGYGDNYIQLEKGKLYQLSVSTDYISCLEVLANEGFERYNEELENLYEEPAASEEESNSQNDYMEMTEENYKKYNNGNYSFRIRSASNNGDGTTSIEGIVYEKNNPPTITKEQYQQLMNGEMVTILEEDYIKNDNDSDAKSLGYDMTLTNDDEDESIKYYIKQNSDGTGTLSRGKEFEFFKNTNIMMEITLDENLKCKFGEEETTLKQHLESPYFIEHEEEYEWLTTLNDEFIFENGKCSTIIFSKV